MYRTTDIILAAYLRIVGIEMVEMVREGARGTFVFNNNERVEEFIRLFGLGQATVEPVSFNNMIKQLTTAVRRL